MTKPTNFDEKIERLLMLGTIDGERRQLIKRGIKEYVSELVEECIGEDDDLKEIPFQGEMEKSFFYGYNERGNEIRQRFKEQLG